MKDYFEKWFNRKELQKITDLYKEALLKQNSAEIGKEKFISEAAKWLANCQRSERLAWEIYLLPVKHDDVSGVPIKENLDEKILIIIKILSERKKDIVEKTRNIVTWSSIVLSLIIGLTGIFLSRCSTIKIDEQQFNEIKQSIQHVNTSKPTNTRMTFPIK